MKEKKKEIIFTLLIMFLIQIFWWAIFTVPNEVLARMMWSERNDNFALYMLEYLSFVMPLIIFVGFLLKEKEIKLRPQLKSWLYNLVIILGWVLTTTISTSLLFFFFGKSLGYCNPDLEHFSGMFGPCFLSGLEYPIMAIYMLTPAAALIVWRIIVWLFKALTKNTDKEKLSRFGLNILYFIEINIWLLFGHFVAFSGIAFNDTGVRYNNFWQAIPYIRVGLSVLFIGSIILAWNYKKNKKYFNVWIFIFLQSIIFVLWISFYANNLIVFYP